MQNLGYIGTRIEPSVEQIEAMIRLLSDMTPTDLHHSNSPGGDYYFHHLAKDRLPKAKVHIYPESNNSGVGCDIKGEMETEPSSYKDNQYCILIKSDVCLITPASSKKMKDDPAWEAFQKALDMKKEVILILPSGELY